MDNTGVISATQAFELLTEEDDLRESAEVLMEDILEAVLNLQGLLQEFQLLIRQQQ